MTLLKRISTLLAGILLVVGLTLPMSAHAQMDDGGTTVRVGPRIGLPVGDLSDATNLFFGADLRVSLGDLPVAANGSFDYYLTDADGLTVYTIDLNALYEFQTGNATFVPYAGGGLGITQVSVDTQFGSASDSDVGLNLVGGARFPVGSVEPFAQLNATLGGDNQRVGITGGLLFAF